jgi:hypothetical protein
LNVPQRHELLPGDELAGKAPALDFPSKPGNRHAALWEGKGKRICQSKGRCFFDAHQPSLSNFIVLHDYSVFIGRSAGQATSASWIAKMQNRGPMEEGIGFALSRWLCGVILRYAQMNGEAYVSQ